MFTCKALHAFLNINNKSVWHFIMKSIKILLLLLTLLPLISKVVAEKEKSGGRKPPPEKTHSHEEKEEVGEHAHEDLYITSTKPPQVLNFPIVNRTLIERNCSKLSWGLCSSSDLLFPVCASNKIVYQNPGVLVCAQLCLPDIELEIFCDPFQLDPEELNHCIKCPEKIEKNQQQAKAAEQEAKEEGIVQSDVESSNEEHEDAGDQDFPDDEEHTGDQDFPDEEEISENEKNDAQDITNNEIPAD